MAVHADLSYEGQTICFPEIDTTAKDTETNSHVSKADEEV
ncbi:MAG: VaFE repeat-containing surface-anchored protein [Coprococcus phoceensis]